jgi:hypothetical protein
MISPLDVPRFSTPAVARALEISIPKLTSFFSRGVIATAPGAMDYFNQPGIGRTRILSARRVLHLALTVRLTPSLEIKTASTLALLFSDMGSADDDFPGFGPGVPARASGEVFGGASRTVFHVALPHGVRPAQASVERLEDIKNSPFIFGHIPRYAALLIDLDDLRQRTLSLLEGGLA